VKRLTGIAAIFAILAIVVPACAGATAPAQLSPAAQSLSRCVQGSGRLSVLMLIDESGSLVKTDPFNQRVAGIRAALTGLADLSETAIEGRRPQVSVLMAGFFGLVHPNPEEGDLAADWKPVSRDDVDQLFEEAGMYEDLNRGRATDYATALTAARQMLATRAAEQTQESGTPPCQALIWFTDGRYSLPQRIGKAGVGLPLTVPYAPGVRLDRPRVGEQAVSDGKHFMCKPNGLMDGLQRDGVTRFTVALATGLSPADAAFLDAATTGSGGAQRCGTHLSRLSGEYLTAQDGDRLFFAFANLLASAPPIRTSSICPKLACVRGETTFVTVPGLSRFLIRASGGSAPSEARERKPLYLQLNGPGGQSVTLKPDAPSHLSLAGTSITQRWVSSRAVEVQGDFSPGSRDWLGHWSYAFVDPSAPTSSAPEANSYSSVQLFADLEPAVEGSPVLIKGVPTALTFNLAKGSEPDAAVTSGPLVNSTHLTASIEDPVAGTSTQVPVVGPKPDGSFTATVTIPRASTAGFVYLGLTANLTTPGGTPIAPQYRSFDLPVRFPPGQGFPTIAPSSLDLPALHGLGDAEGTLTVKGSSVGGGCVWVGSPKTEAPSGAGRIRSSILPAAGSSARCIRLGKGETRRFTVRLTPSSEASGTVTASVPVHLHSEIVKGDRVVSVPVSFAMAPAPNEAERAVLLVVLVLLGALLPLLLLHVLNLLGARFPAPNRLRAIVLPVEMSEGGALRRIGDGSEDELGRGVSLASHGSKPTNGLEVGGVKLETVASGSLRDRTFELFRGPSGAASAGGRRLIAGTDRPLRSWRDGTTHEVSLGLVGTWIFRLDALHPAERIPVEKVANELGESTPAALEGAFFGSATAKREAAPPELAPRGPRQATIEGELILLISDGPPLDQGDVLFKQAEQELKEAEQLWDEVRPEPGPESATPEEPAESGEEAEVSDEAPEPPRQESNDSWAGSAPQEKSNRTSKKRSKGNYFE
jgi:hypothetical protein